MKLSFYGGAREVTGACYLLEVEDPSTHSVRSGSTKMTRILVDCGLFQGTHECTELNYKNFPFDPAGVDLLLVTHAHLDHVGRIPKLVRDGFRGKILSTAPTKDLAELILRDALSLARREDSELYGEADLEHTVSLWEDVPYQKIIESGGIKFRFNEAGHILGSAMIDFWVEGKRVLFTGDLGNVPSALLPPPEFFGDIEYLIIESTYGSKTHEPSEERVLRLERAVEDAASRGGTLMIPSFATERTQDMLFYLNSMLHFKRIPEIPVFVDAPLAIKVTAVFEKYPQFYKEEIRALYREHPNLFRFKRLRLTETVEQSKSINEVRPPKVILAGSGMMNGGRILHHARRYLPDPASMLLIIGYQAGGSLGRRLIDGEKTVKLFGEELLVNAEIRKISGFSAHADSAQLYAFVESNRDRLKKVFAVQGEEAQALHLVQEIKDRLGIEAEAPLLGETREI